MDSFSFITGGGGEVLNEEKGSRGIAFSRASEVEQSS